LATFLILALKGIEAYSSRQDNEQALLVQRASMPCLMQPPSMAWWTHV